MGENSMSLQDAIEANDLAALERLVDAGHDPDVGDPERDSPLSVAAQRHYGNAPSRDPELIELLLKRGASPGKACAKGRTPLHDAVINYKSRNVDLLLDAGAPIDAQDIWGEPPIFFVKTREAFEQLERRGANLRLVTKEGETLLRRIAVRSSDGLWILKRLVELGVKPEDERPDSSGTTTLMQAISRRHGGDDVVYFLIERGVDVLARAKDGTTALHNAAEEADVELVTRLLALDADPNAKNAERKRPLDLVKTYSNNYAAIKKLLQAGQPARPPIPNQVTVTKRRAQIVVPFDPKNASGAFRELGKITAALNKNVLDHPSIAGEASGFEFLFQPPSGTRLDEKVFFAKYATNAAATSALTTYVTQTITVNRKRGEPLYVHEELEVGMLALEALLVQKTRGAVDLLAKYVKSIDVDHTVYLYELMDRVRATYVAKELKAVEGYLRARGIEGPEPEATAAKKTRPARKKPAAKKKPVMRKNPVAKKSRR